MVAFIFVDVEYLFIRRWTTSLSLQKLLQHNLIILKTCRIRLLNLFAKVIAGYWFMFLNHPALMHFVMKDVKWWRYWNYSELIKVMNFRVCFHLKIIEKKIGNFIHVLMEHSLNYQMSWTYWVSMVSYSSSDMRF